MRASAAVAAASARARHALSAALGASSPAPPLLAGAAGASKWNARGTTALRGPARRPPQATTRGNSCGRRLAATPSAVAGRDSTSAAARPRFMSTLAEERERDFNPTFANDVFSGVNREKTEAIPLPQRVLDSLSNPAGVTFPRVDQFDRFLDYTPHDDEEPGYPDLGVSFPRVRVPGKYTIPLKADDPVDLLRETSGVDVGYYRGLFKRVVEVRFRTIYLKGGKTKRLRITVIVGDGKGSAGLGTGEAADTRTAVRLAYVDAYRQMESFYIYDKRTLHSGGEFKYKGYRCSFTARSPGHGKRVHHIFYDLCEAVGIKDVGGKVRGTRQNRRKIIYAYFAFLRSQRPPRDVARARGLKMTDLMHIYYGRPQES